MSRCCIVTPDLAGPSRNGGIGTYCLHLARFFAGRGDQVTVLHTGHIDVPDLDHWRDFLHEDCAVQLLFLGDLPDDPPVHVAPHSQRHTISHRVYRWLKAKDFDSIHFQDWQGNGAVSMRAKHTGCAFINTLLTVTAHSSSEWIREGMGEFPDQGMESLIDDTLERTSVELADVIVCASVHMRDWLQNRSWRLPEKIEFAPCILNNVVDADRDGSLAPGALEEIIFFGRLETRKGLLPFLDALEQLAKNEAFSTPRITFLGRHHETLRGSSEDLIAKFSGKHSRRFSIQVFSNLDQPSALAFLRERQNALVVTPSLADNAPYSVVECLTSGFPLLTSTRGGIPELVGDPTHMVEPEAGPMAERLLQIATDGLSAPTVAYSADQARETWERVASEKPVAPAAEASKPSISVIIPHFEHASVLQETIDALEKQTLIPSEVIVVDDGSTSKETIDALATTEKRLAAKSWKLIRGNHAGPAAARNLGAQKSTGDALVFVDADNPPKKTLVESLATAMATSRSDVVTCAFHAVHASKPDGRPEYLFCPLGPFVTPALLTNTLGDTNMIVRRDVFLNLGGFDATNISAPEDWQFLLKAVRQNTSMAVVPDPLFNYRLSKSSRARSNSEPEGVEAALAALTPEERSLVTPLAQLVRGTSAKMQALIHKDEVTARQLAMIKSEMAAQTERFRSTVAELIGQHKQDTDNIHRALVQLERDRFQLEEKCRVREHEIARHQAALGKIRQMQGSFSWRATAPLRSLRRLLIDPISGRGRPPVASTNTDSDSSPDKLEVQSKISAKFMQAIDTPIVWHGMHARRFTVRGWVLRRDRRPVDVVRVRCGTDVFEARVRMGRTDVFSVAPDHPYASTAGFEADARVTGEMGELFVEARTQDEPWECFFHTKWTTGPNAQESSPDLYEAWIRRNEDLSSKALRKLAENVSTWPFRPLISVVMPVYNTPARWLIAAIESVRAQAYGRWELCIADDASTATHIRPLLEDYQELDDRIRVIFRNENGHIAKATNSALEIATGEWTVFLDHDDLLAPHALAEVARTALSTPNAGLIYSDEDKVDEQGMRFEPYFKCDWMPDLFLGQNFVIHLSAYRTDQIRKFAGLRDGFDGSQDWDLALRVIEHIPPEGIVHIPKILYHWRAIPGSTATSVGEKTYSVESAKRAITEHFERTGVTANVTGVPGEHWRIQYPCPKPKPRVTLIIPTRDKVGLLRQCVDSIIGSTSYSNYQIVIVDNESKDRETIEWLREVKSKKVRVIRYHKPFNYSALNNFAVSQTSGEIIGFLNNDLEVMNEDWLHEMVSHACRPRAGCVGAMLYYPDETVQHAGVLLGVGGVAGHAFTRYVRGTDGYFNRLRLVQNYSAVTGACMVMKREVFTEVGGFNETDLAIAFNDVDLCLRVHKAGYLNIWTPFAEFIHHESASRGPEDTPEKQNRFGKEIEYMRRTWGAELDNDPAYSPHLSLDFSDFSIASPPRPFIG